MSLPVLNASPCLAHGCAECCHDTQMPLLQEDVDRLAALGHDPARFVKRGEEGHMQLNTVDPPEGQTKRPCYFLREGRCGVYADRPAGCRIYPLVLNEQSRLMRDEDCPHRHEFALDASAKRRIQRIQGQLVRETREALRGRRA